MATGETCLGLLSPAEDSDGRAQQQKPTSTTASYQRNADSLPQYLRVGVTSKGLFFEDPESFIPKMFCFYLESGSVASKLHPLHGGALPGAAVKRTYPLAHAAAKSVTLLCSQR